MLQPVRIVNNTDYTASGKVEYFSFLCSNDDYTVGPHSKWSAKRRGFCTVTKLSAVLATPSGNIEATAFTSSIMKRDWDEFWIVQIDDNTLGIRRTKFEVQCIR
jgi:hypothetical protein